MSSSQRRARTTLKRREPTPENTPAQPASSREPDSQTAPADSSSSSTDTPESAAAEPQSALVITPEDREKAKGVTEPDRAAFVILRTGLDMHLNTHTGAVETRAQILVKNIGGTPLRCLPLRISGALQWESARQSPATIAHVASGSPGQSLTANQYLMLDDLDHTGIAKEIALALVEPLAPGKTIGLDLYYTGTLSASSQRLTTIGAPAGRAALTDWDTVSDTFTGLRGLGNVLWYPVAGPTAHLRDGDAFTRTIESSRERDALAAFQLHLTLEYSGSRPDAAFFLGDRQVLKPLTDVEQAGAPSPAGPGVVTADWNRAALGPHTPSLFIVDAAPHTAADGLLRIVTEHADTAAALGEAVTRIRSMIVGWLGAGPSKPLDVLDLPVPGAAGFVDGRLIVAPLTTGFSAALAQSLVQPLASAWLPQNLHAAWLRDGIPAFLQMVWNEETSGRDTALKQLAATTSALRAQAEVESHNTSIREDSTPLSLCSDAVCARNKAAYVLGMLRGMMGDEHLQQVLSGWSYRVEQAESAGILRSDTSVEMQKHETALFEQAVQQAVAPKDISWFFRDWIDEDHGLPDLTIVTVAPRHIERAAPVDYLPAQRKPVAGPIGAEPLPPDPRDLPDGGVSPSSSSSSGAVPAAGSWLVAVEVQNNGSAEAEVSVTVRAGNLTNTLPLRVPAHGRATIRVPFEAEPQEVLVNDGSVPEARISLHRRNIASVP